MVEELSKIIEKQKIKAIGARNLLQGMEKQKEHNQQQLHVRRVFLYLINHFLELENQINFLFRQSLMRLQWNWND